MSDIGEGRWPKGAKIKCHRINGIGLTKDKTYTVLGHYKDNDGDIMVTIIDDGGQKVTLFAKRFTLLKPKIEHYGIVKWLNRMEKEKANAIN